MAASRRSINVRNVVFTPSAGQAVMFSGITGVDFDAGGQILKFSGDGDRFPTLSVNVFSDPSVTINTADKQAAASCSVGTRGVLTWTEKDAKNQTASVGPGDLVWTLNTAVVETVSGGQQHKQFGTAMVKFAAESIDGLTPPLTLSIAS